MGIGAYYPGSPTPPPLLPSFGSGGSFVGVGGGPLLPPSSACSSPGPQQHQHPPQQAFTAVPSRLFPQGQYNGSGGNLLMLHQKAQLAGKAAAAVVAAGGLTRVASAAAVGATEAAAAAPSTTNPLLSGISLGGLSAGGQQAVLRIASMCASLYGGDCGGGGSSSAGGGGGSSSGGNSSKSSPDLSRVLEAVGLSSMFPYLTARLSPGGAAAAAAIAAAALARGEIGANSSIKAAASSGGGATPATIPTSGLSSHLAYVSLLNQVVTVGTQLHHDASSMPAHHKYAAHQVALLYQSLNALGGAERTRPLRRAIEARFDALKRVTEAQARPVLPAELAAWVQRVTWVCREEVRGVPAYAHRRLAGLAGAARQRPTRRGVAAAVARMVAVAAQQQQQQVQQSQQQWQQQPYQQQQQVRG
jgi:hypothetical protein